MQTNEIIFQALERVESHKDKRIQPHIPAIIAGIRSAFNQPGFDETDILNHLTGDLIVLGMFNQDLVGYASTDFNQSPRTVFGEAYPADQGCYFVAGTVVREFQQCGIYQQLNMKRIQEAMKRGQQLIFTRTQNPFVEAGIHHSLVSLGVEPQVERYYAGGSYGRMLTASRPVHRDPELNRLYSQLDYDAGDAFVLMYYLQNKEG